MSPPKAAEATIAAVAPGHRLAMLEEASLETAKSFVHALAHAIAQPELSIFPYLRDQASPAPSSSVP
jgi:hypothetical protein